MLLNTSVDAKAQASPLKYYNENELNVHFRMHRSMLMQVQLMRVSNI